MINPLKEGNVHKMKRTYQSNKKVIELYITVGASNPFCCSHENNSTLQKTKREAKEM